MYTLKHAHINILLHTHIYIYICTHYTCTCSNFERMGSNGSVNSLLTDFFEEKKESISKFSREVTNIIDSRPLFSNTKVYTYTFILCILVSIHVYLLTSKYI